MAFHLSGGLSSGDKIGLWRYRVGKYRIVCKLEDDVCTILVLQIAKRDKVYDRDL